MTHRSESDKSLKINQIKISNCNEIVQQMSGFEDVCLVVLSSEPQKFLDIDNAIDKANSLLGKNATLILVGEPAALVHIQTKLALFYQLWISIKQRTIHYHATERGVLPNHHFEAIVHTNYYEPLKHILTRIQYTYCPACDKTTKDYGGKKHTYNPYGTLISDIWRDISCDLEEDLSEVFQRFADLFGLDTYHELRVLDCRSLNKLSRKASEKKSRAYKPQLSLFSESSYIEDKESRLINGDCLEILKRLPNNSIDFAFADPPYNLKKNYNNYSDDLSVQEYFLWCDQWIEEIVRVLRPGRTLSIINIPLWSIRHFQFMEKILKFQNWIVWDALSFPVRKIMPAHYAILCFSKGQSRPLPGLINTSGDFNILSSPTFSPLSPLGEKYCLRSHCVRKRTSSALNDRGILTDLWWDIHRLKHNSRRVDHSCQLPPQLMYRLISIFTEPGEMVLDCFNGVGTTTLSAHQLERNYIGIELSEKYHQIAEIRHEEIRQGLDPFRKESKQLIEKNSRVPRRFSQNYEVSKKTLQLEVRRVANQLSKMPSREDVINYAKYPIRYYDEYFSSWGEVCAAVRNDGMSETKTENLNEDVETLLNKSQQLSLFNQNQ